jgi:hypothetical protein
MRLPSKDQVARVRAAYPSGTRIEVTVISDPYSKLYAGCLGTVEFVDDTGSLFCAFDNGEHIGLLYGVDGYRKVPVIDEKVREQILAIRTEPNCPNMFDTNAVQRLAYDLGYYELVNFLETDRGAYSRFILAGE